MLNEDKIEIIEYKEEYQKDIIDFLVQTTTEEFGHPEWRDYFERKLVEQYKKGNNNFWIVLDSKKHVIGTCGALQQSDKVIKMNCFYINSKYRGTGLGEKLYDFFMDFIKKENYETIILCTYKEFDRAIKFYEKRGFELQEIIEDELWYKKEL